MEVPEKAQGTVGAAVHTSWPVTSDGTKERAAHHRVTPIARSALVTMAGRTLRDLVGSAQLPVSSTAPAASQSNVRAIGGTMNAGNRSGEPPRDQPRHRPRRGCSTTLGESLRASNRPATSAAAPRQDQWSRSGRGPASSSPSTATATAPTTATTTAPAPAGSPVASKGKQDRRLSKVRSSRRMPTQPTPCAASSKYRNPS